MLHKNYYVYIITNGKYGALYIGITSDLIKRVFEHKESLIDGFTKKYKINQLVYYEIHFDVREAILKEKQIKKWNREWKISLIEKGNPQWLDLYYELM